MINDAYLSFARNALARARDLKEITRVVRSVTRRVTRADGATVVLREREFCYYADEDAIGPLWKGHRFPLKSCVTGMAMMGNETIVIPDVYRDARVPLEAYRPTFVRSLAVTPVGNAPAVAALGIYWAEHHTANTEELQLLAALAALTATSLANCRRDGDGLSGAATPGSR